MTNRGGTESPGTERPGTERRLGIDVPENLDGGGGEVAPLIGQSSVWGDAWRYLRTNPLFLLGLAIVVVMVSMALVPKLFARGIVPRSSQHLILARTAHSQQHGVSATHDQRDA